MKVQVIEDGKGNPAGVFIPIQEWALLEKKINILKDSNTENASKRKLVNELKTTFNELVQIEKGKLKARPIEEFLNEL